FCIMPNHVHCVFTPLPKSGETYYSMSNILHSLKRHTALRANQILERQGGFWQHENYDHVVRGEKEFNRIVDYVLNNPVSAGLVSSREEWKWSYCKTNLREAFVLR
ncbi:MAG: transposase, partial [bacterium]|nr:transposase [bacterium]